MDIFKLYRNFWDFCFENPEKIKPNDIAIFSFAIEHCNRLGWKKKFGFPASMVMDATGIKSYSVYKKHLDNLVSCGFILMIEYSKNQYSSNIIALEENYKANNKANNKALDKAIIKHSTKQSESTIQSTVQSIDSINKPIYNNTNLPINNINEAIASQENLSKENPNEIFPQSESVEPGTEERKKVAPKKEKYFNKDDFKKKLLELGVKEKHANDWIQIRKDKRASFTESAIDGIIRECEKHNFPFPEAIRNCAESNWQGFKYEWIKNKNQNSNGITNTTNTGFSTSKPSTNNGNSGKRSYRQILAERLTNELKANGEGSNITIDAEICE